MNMPGQDYKYTLEQHDGYATLGIHVEKLDLFDTPDILIAVENRIKDLDYPNCLVDLKDVFVIDSTGIGLLIALNNLLAKKGKKMAVMGISERVSEIFRITKMSTFFKTVSNGDEANRFFNP